MNLYLSRNHKGTFYYRDRYWSFDNGIDSQPPENATYCTYCGGEGSIFVLKRYLNLDATCTDKFKCVTITCIKHKYGEIQMALTEAQKELYNKVFCEQKELLNNHPFMEIDEVSGTKKINRDKCLELLNNLTEAEFMLRTKQQAIVWALEESIKDVSEGEKKRIREYDRTHKHKSGLEIEKERAAGLKSPGISKEEKLILSVMERLGCSRDEAVKWIED